MDRVQRITFSETYEWITLDLEPLSADFSRCFSFNCADNYLFNLGLILITSNSDFDSEIIQPI